jgi:hypothetical protein
MMTSRRVDECECSGAENPAGTDPGDEVDGPPVVTSEGVACDVQVQELA